MIQAKAFVKDGKLCIVGVSPSGLGPVPFAVAQTIPPGSNIPDGPVDVNEPGQLEEILLKAEKKIMHSVTHSSVSMGAEQLVRRARAGDQVAMGIISQVAKSGGETALRAKRAIADYIKRNPSRHNSSFGNELSEPVLTAGGKALHKALVKTAKSPESWAAAMTTLLPRLAREHVYTAIVAAADGPPLNGKNKDALYNALREPEKKAFSAGRKASWHDLSQVMGLAKRSKMPSDAVMLGWICGKADRLQRFRKGGPASLISNMVAWELGENIND
jgi:hypothetical protein